MDEKLRQTYLYDFYGELLNEHQRRIYEDFIFQDFSQTEIAREEGISRQGVADLVRRCQRKLEDYESKLHLVERFLSVKREVGRIHVLAEEFQSTGSSEIIGRIEEITNRILEEL